MTTTEVKLDEVLLYARCGLEWYWEFRAHMKRPEAVTTMLADSVRQGLAFYYGGFAATLERGIEMVWHDWAEEWGDPSRVNDLAEYATGRNQIMAAFRNGQYTRPGGTPYDVPQMTAKFRDLMHSNGLLKLGTKLDQFAESRNFLLPKTNETVFSGLGDAFADCLEAARLNARTLPARTIVRGASVPYRSELPGELAVLGTADLVIEGKPKTPRDVILEVHQFQRDPFVRFGLGSRDLRVIAATLARPNPDARDEGAPVVDWDAVARVDFRHWPTGEVFQFHGGNVGQLQLLLSATLRGMRMGVVVPRALTGYDDCRSCAYRDLCWGDAWQELSLIDPTNLARGDELVRLVSGVRAAVSGDEAAAERARQALLIVERHVAGDYLDPHAQREAMAEAFHALQPAPAATNGGRHADHAG
jgi:hypothetical protein